MHGRVVGLSGGLADMGEPGDRLCIIYCVLHWHCPPTIHTCVPPAAPWRSPAQVPSHQAPAAVRVLQPPLLPRSPPPFRPPRGSYGTTNSESRPTRRSAALPYARVR